MRTFMRAAMPLAFAFAVAATFSNSARASEDQPSKTYGVDTFRDFWYPGDSLMKRSI